MTAWKSADMAAMVPSAIVDLADSAASVSSATATLLEVIKTGIILSRPLIGFLAFDFASVLIAAVDAFKEDFLGTGFYACSMWDYPVRQYYRTGIRGETFSESFEADLVKSLSDPLDPNVPTFSSDTAMLVLVGGTAGSIYDLLSTIGVVATGFPSWSEISATFDAVTRFQYKDAVSSAIDDLKSGATEYSGRVAEQTSKVFELKRARQQANELISDLTYLGSISNPLPTIKDINDYIDAVNSTVGASAYPDWESISLKKIIPPLPGLVDEALDPLTAALQAGSGIMEAIDGFIEVLDYKITQLQVLVDKIDEFLSEFEGIISIGSLYSLYITSSNGMVGLAQELATVTNQPFGEDTGFYTGVALVAGGPGLTPFSNLFGAV